MADVVEHGGEDVLQGPAAVSPACDTSCTQQHGPLLQHGGPVHVLLGGGAGQEPAGVTSTRCACAALCQARHRPVRQHRRVARGRRSLAWAAEYVQELHQLLALGAVLAVAAVNTHASAAAKPARLHSRQPSRRTRAGARAWKHSQYRLRQRERWHRHPRGSTNSGAALAAATAGSWSIYQRVAQIVQIRAGLLGAARERGWPVLGLESAGVALQDQLHRLRPLRLKLETFKRVCINHHRIALRACSGSRGTCSPAGKAHLCAA